MPDRRGVTLLEDLPEVIIDEILKRLPPKDAGRCRAVSTSWRSITSTPEFMLENHRHQPSLPIIDGRGQPASFVLFRGADTDASNQQLWPFIPGLKHYNLKPSLVVTCDGFLILLQQNKFYIYNPVMRKRALLPYPQAGKNECSNIIGFYRHQLTGEYRLLGPHSVLCRWLNTAYTFSQWDHMRGTSESECQQSCHLPQNISYWRHCAIRTIVHHQSTLVAACTGVLFLFVVSPTLLEAAETLLCSTQKQSHSDGCAVLTRRTLIGSYST